MVGENDILTQIDVSSFSEFEISEFEISRVDCISKERSGYHSTVSVDFAVNETASLWRHTDRTTVTFVCHDRSRTWTRVWTGHGPGLYFPVLTLCNCTAILRNVNPLSWSIPEKLFKSKHCRCCFESAWLINAKWNWCRISIFILNLTKVLFVRNASSFFQSSFVNTCITKHFWAFYINVHIVIFI